jgi:hypothetical protein
LEKVPEKDFVVYVKPPIVYFARRNEKKPVSQLEKRAMT